MLMHAMMNPRKVVWQSMSAEVRTPQGVWHAAALSFNIQTQHARICRSKGWGNCNDMQLTVCEVRSEDHHPLWLEGVVQVTYEKDGEV
jgi:hypothetical protein